MSATSEPESQTEEIAESSHLSPALSIQATMWRVEVPASQLEQAFWGFTLLRANQARKANLQATRHLLWDNGQRTSP